MNFSNCFICRAKLNASILHVMYCGCPHGSPVCLRCKSISGQRQYVDSSVCNHCSRKGKEICAHAQPLLCCMCSTSGHICNPSINFCQMVQSWASLRNNKSLVRRNALFARMVKDWRMFSRFYYQNFCLTMHFNPWTQEKKQAFFQLWSLSQMNYPVGPCRMIQNHSNLWESYPHSSLYISREFSWRFRLFPWVRKLICKISMSSPIQHDAMKLFRQSYLHRCSSARQMMVSFIIRYLMAQNAEIFALTI